MMDLSDRKKKILQAVIDEYIGTAEPVGSRAISKNSALKLSSATIRNEMSDLEEMGFLIQPHTSAGRIPSDEGYRFYVSSLMKNYQMGMEAVMELQKAFQMRIMQLDRIIEYAGRIASSLTDYTTFVTLPDRGVSKIRKFDLIPMALEKTMLLAVTDVVHSQLMDIKLKNEECASIAELLNSSLAGMSADTLTGEILQEVHQGLFQAVKMDERTAETIMKTVYEIIGCKDAETDVYISNEKLILKYPEYRDVKKANQMFSFLENKSKIRSVINSDTADKITVKIGDENQEEVLKDCSLISVNYSVGDKKGGKIGVIGPKRMNYAKVFSSLDIISKEIDKILRYYTEE